MTIILRQSVLIIIIVVTFCLLGLVLGLRDTIVHKKLPYSLPVILLDPGHGGIDSGTHDHQGLEEKNITLNFAFLLKAELEKFGFTVYLTRTDDRELSKLAPYQGTRQRTDLLARANLVTFYNADLLISIHVNAATDANFSGAITFYQQKNPKSKDLASHIQKALQQIQPDNKQTILYGDFYLLNVVKIPSVLLELAFITNAKDHQSLKDPEFLQKMAFRVSNGIYNYTIYENKPSIFIHFHKKSTEYLKIFSTLVVFSTSLLHR